MTSIGDIKMIRYPSLYIPNTRLGKEKCSSKDLNIRYTPLKKDNVSDFLYSDVLRVYVIAKEE